jgi:predicted dehydrogenase
MSDHPVSRRDFVGDTAKIALGAVLFPPTIVPRHVLGRGYRAPSDTVNLAFVGIGGMGMSNASALLSENFVAICDVDFNYVERSLGGRTRPRQTPTSAPANVPADQAQAWLENRRRADQRALEDGQKMQAQYTKAKKYADFREMLDKQKDIDGVVVATPDHLHAVIAARAMKAGKSVYVQKPLTYSVHEARTLAKIARENPKVVTQMGNQGHSGDGTRRIMELIAANAIGAVRDVHVWTDRPLGYWAQGIPRPQVEQAMVMKDAVPTGNPRPAAAAADPNARQTWTQRTVDQAVQKYMSESPMSPPAGLDWDLFLGPAPQVPYHPAFHPFSWRGWVDYGVSAIGDMGAHLIDQPFWALGLDYPTAISASSTPWGGGSPNARATYPLAMTVTYEFAARGNQPPVKLHWYDGGLMPSRPPFLPDDVTLPRSGGGGGVFVGDKGILVYGTYGNNPTIYPSAVAQAAESIPKTFPRVETSHEMNWINAIRGTAKPSSEFEYASKLTETMLLGIIALRAGEGKKVFYDGPNMRVTNAPEVNQFLTREYRAGWSL